MKIFCILGEKIYDMLDGIRGGCFSRKQSAYDIKNLYPGKGTEGKIKDYYSKKIAVALCICLVGIVFAAGSVAAGYWGHEIEDERYITRNTYGQGEKQINITAGYEDGRKEEVTLYVGERRLKDEELERLYDQAKIRLSELVFPEGICADEVRGNLFLPGTVEGYPFEIQWESSDYSLIDYDGTVYNEELPENGMVVNLSASFRYHEFKREFIFPVHIFPVLLSEEQRRRQILEAGIEENEKKSIYEEKYILPNQIGGEEIKWEEAKEDSAGIILLLSSLAAVLIYCMKDYDLHKQVLHKREEMFESYPEVVNRLVLYVGAGMTVRNAWRKIAMDYAKKQNRKEGGKRGYIYQEMLFACYEMDSGVAEGEAYERFGRRCGIQQYVKLATLLVQNMQKGNSTMLQQLKEEAETAFVQRMNQARKKGEEAGTKLLMPMMILFGMVLVMIMIPAFGTFGM